MMVQLRKNLKHSCHPEGLESHFQFHQYFDIIFNLSLAFSWTLLFFWTLSKYIFALQIGVFRDLNGIIITLNLVSLPKLFITKHHMQHLYSIPQVGALKLKIQNINVLFDLLPSSCQKILQSKNTKYFITLLQKKSDIYKNRERNKINTHVPIIAAKNNL